MRTPFPIKLRNQTEKEPCFSQFLYAVMYCDMGMLLITPFILLAIIGLLFGLLNKYILGCHESIDGTHSMGLVSYFSIAMGDLIGNHLLTEDVVKNLPLCVLSVSLAGYIGLIVQAVVFGLVCQRVLRPPQKELLMSDRCVLAPRDGHPVLTTC